jgi:hypothetical protein
MKSVIKAERLSIVPVGGDSREVRATDTLPVICWTNRTAEQVEKLASRELVI